MLNPSHTNCALARVRRNRRDYKENDAHMNEKQITTNAGPMNFSRSNVGIAVPTKCNVPEDLEQPYLYSGV